MPDSPDTVKIEQFLIADQWYVFRLSLCDQHPVERVFVWSGELPGADRVICRDSQMIEARLPQLSLKVGSQHRRRGEASEANLRGNFPRRRSAHKQSIFRICHE